MDTIIIICLIIGAACVAVSFLMKENTGVDSQEKEKIAEEIRAKVLSNESIEKVMSKVEKGFTDKLSAIAENKIEESDDRLSEISNNKMLAINEMSGQLIEKIEQNHKEVIFLYDMLNEKSDNLKDFSAKVEGLRKELENEEKRIKTLNHDLDDKIVKVKEVRQTVIARPAKTMPVQQEKTEKASTGIERVKAASVNVTNVDNTQADNLVQMQKKEKDETIQNADDKIESDQDEIKEVKVIQVKSESKAELSTNDKILKMKEEGKSIIEISKALGMGQGEVRLILGLFDK
jgi:hypothetical protein